MIKILLIGCGGHMGRVITDIVSADETVEIVAGVDPVAGQFDYPVYADCKECEVKADVAIDFSSYKAVDSVIDYCSKKALPLVECTTGLSSEQIKSLKELSKKTAVLRSANMSLGINTLIKLISEAAKILTRAGFDVEIVEKHHRRKIDAPSGTALLLADSLNSACGDRYSYIYDRSERHEPRDENEIGISAVRGGTIVGEHDVIFAGEDEVIELKHTAFSRSVFAKGAVEAAKFLAKKTSGMYDMQDVTSKDN